MLFEYVKEMPKEETSLRLDIASLIGPLFFTWVILLLFPVSLLALGFHPQILTLLNKRSIDLGNDKNMK